MSLNLSLEIIHVTCTFDRSLDLGRNPAIDIRLPPVNRALTRKKKYD